MLDQGPGIAADVLPHIFGKFYRVVGPEQRADSTGLGLAICKGIVEPHEGRISVENQTSGGTCFIISLPALQAHSE